MIRKINMQEINMKEMSREEMYEVEGGVVWGPILVAIGLGMATCWALDTANEYCIRETGKSIYEHGADLIRAGREDISLDF